MGSLDFLDGLGDAIEAAAAKALLQAGTKIQGDAKHLCPVRESKKGGRLRESITARLDYEDGEAVVTVGTNVNYAPYMEFGTGQRGAETNIMPEDAGISYGSVKGVPAQPFLYPAAKQNASFVAQHVAAAVKAAIGNKG